MSSPKQTMLMKLHKFNLIEQFFKCFVTVISENYLFAVYRLRVVIGVNSHVVPAQVAAAAEITIPPCSQIDRYCMLGL